LTQDIRVLAKERAAQGTRLSLLQDIVFKDVFTADDDDSRKALSRLISVCIHREVSAVQVLNSEVSPEYAAGKMVRFDIHVKFNDGETADLEMQMGPSDDNISSRAVFYAVRLLSGQGTRGEDYADLKQAYQIFFFNGLLFPGRSSFPRRYHLAEDTEHDRLSDLIEILFYELGKLEPKAQAILEGRESVKNLTDEERWCLYLKYHRDEDKVELIKELIREDEGLMSTERVLDKVSQDYEEWAKALFWEKAEMNYRSGMGRVIRERDAARQCAQTAQQRAQIAQQRAQTAQQRAQTAEQRVAELERKLREAGLSG
jgi:predicted transposase/invertase (TIGR01784 family)